MENLSVNDAPGSIPPPGPPAPPQQLPPQLFTTAASLLDLTDKKLLVTLRDGRKLIGILRSWDQYGNLVLQNTIERRFLAVPNAAAFASDVATAEGAKHIFSDDERGIYLVRGENIILMGEIDLDRDDLPPPGSVDVDPLTLHREDKRQTAERKRKEANRLRKLKALGFEGESSGDVIF